MDALNLYEHGCIALWYSVKVACIGSQMLTPARYIWQVDQCFLCVLGVGCLVNSGPRQHSQASTSPESACMTLW